MRPVIGITSYVEPARWGVWDQRAALVPYRYVQHVISSGGRPVILPPLADGAAETVASIDGLLLAGGADLDPARYGEQPHPQTNGVRPDRDAGEFALLRTALAVDLPVLGICRGMQLLTAHSGGSLHQHLPDVVGHEGHRPAPGTYGEHPVYLGEGSQLRGILGEKVTVSSYHHQGIADVGSHASATGWAEDSSVEAIEINDHTFAVGVLWHPEVGTDPRLFDALVQCAAGPQ